ncbi:thermonuclease family protein [Azospirillum canadense]|uniref:thermonuclease family protein n=1 Tax=Azospirillum canadense TaxID=403962 RepID=UPI002226E808|nr:thermonuclease family protein [Azospirillum canadense]MCW2238283.1 endonuclease YncB(thermonuclease family) [Azospirillum canadense]
MTRSLPSVLLALLLVALAPIQAAAQRLRAAVVVDGDTLELEDGRRLRLAGIEAAKPPPNAQPGTRWPLAEAATAALAELALGRDLSPRGEARTDRHGRLVAQLQRDDGLWLQGALLARGLARVHTQPDSRALAREMLAAEDAARTAGLGVWRTHAYGVRAADDPDAVARDRDSFQVLEGRVLRVTKAGSEAYLDFGEDWRTDVTVHIGRGALRAFTQAGIDPLSYEGRRVRVRGWVGLRSGPMIEATHPEQIERLEDGRAPVPRVSGALKTEPPVSGNDPEDEDAD